MTASKMTINGVEVEGGFGRIQFNESVSELAAQPSRAVSGSYVCDLEATDANAVAEFFEGLAPRDAAPPEAILHGKGNASSASFATLGKRYFYGGRKARSAKRRMIAGIFGPTRVQLQSTERNYLAFACPFPFQKAKE